MGTRGTPRLYAATVLDEAREGAEWARQVLAVMDEATRDGTLTVEEWQEVVATAERAAREGRETVAAARQGLTFARMADNCLRGGITPHVAEMAAQDAIPLPLYAAFDDDAA